jgi:RimJ/RimL family protein N-acetyltransferase
LILRDWREEDVEPFAAMNADPEVMEHFPAPLTREETMASVERIRAQRLKHGFGLWAVEVPGVAPFIGFVGLMVPTFEAHFTPCVEVGWRIARAYWGAGYATEGARASVRYAFEQLKLAEIVSMTIPANVRSQRVMQKLGMTRDPKDDFDHPRVPEGSHARRHVLYRLKRP